MKTKCVVSIVVILLLWSLCGAAVQCSGEAIRIISQTPGQIKLKLDVPSPSLNPVELGSQQVQEVRAAGAESTADEGLPALPLYSLALAIPARGNWILNYSSNGVRTTPLANPKLVDPLDSGNPVPSKLSQLTGARYPEQLVTASAPVVLRDFRLMQVSVTPYQYNLQTQELEYCQSVEITIDLASGAGINEIPDYTTYSPAFRDLYSAQIANFASYRSLNLAPPQPRILLIHGNSTDQIFLSKLNEFVAWKRQKGFDVNVASTQVAGTSNTAIKNYIQNQYNNTDTRPDYIILLGDTSGSYAVPTFYETMSSYNGEGDYPYTFLAGNDLLGDVFIGRISVDNVSQFAAYVNKVYAVEKNLNLAGGAAAWLDRMLLVGDPSTSGMSCVYTNKFIRDMAVEVHPEYSFIEAYTGSYSSTMNSGINQGVGFFHYRGYYGVSGWSPNASSLNNGYKLPHSVVITCGTNSFAGGTSPMEDFIRMGTEAVPKGALTAIGMATTGTHTMFNNSLSCGIYEGILSHKMRSMGEALLNGRLYIWTLYGSSNPTQANYFAHWCNLMGDPTAEAYVGIPEELMVNAPVSLPIGTSLVDIFVTDTAQIPVEGASVSLFNASYGNVVAKGITDETGMVSLNIPSFVTSELIVTAAKHDCKPVQQTIAIDAAGSLVYFSKMTSDNGQSGSSGNSDGFANPGETIAIWIDVKNTMAGASTSLTATLASSDPYITVTSPQSTYPSIVPSATVMNDTPFLFTVQPNPPALHDVRLELTLVDSLGIQYAIPFHVGLFNGNLNVTNYSVSAGGNSILDPGETGILQLSVLNNSVFGISDVYGELHSLNDLIVVTDSTSFFGNIPANMTIPSIDNFTVFARPLLIPGMMIPFSLRLYNSSGFEQTSYFNVPIGSVSQNTPLGPDEYGYFIYDETDTAFSDCPSYDWIEIHPSLGGSGSLITGLNDSGTSGDEGDQVGSVVTAVVDLPFTFTYYGVDYNQITVCVNGFIALGVTEDGEFRNGRMPGGQGPSPMIAAFWDDLILISDAGIYRYYDANEHIFIVQYHKMRNGYNRTSEETFQVIFYDPQFHPTSLGDGMIKLQYKVFNNVDIGSGGYTPRHGNYCSIGLRDQSNTRGLEYTFNNQYPPTAAPLSHQKALLITTAPVLHQTPYLVVGEVIVMDTNANSILEPGETAEIGIKLSNLGLNTATNVQISATSLSPMLTLVNSQSPYPNIPGSGSAVNQNPLVVQVSEACADNTSLGLECVVTIDGNVWTYPINLIVHKPLLTVANVYLNDTTGNGNGLAEPGETFNLIVNYANNGSVDALDITSNIVCISDDVTIANPEQVISRIPTQSIRQAVYQITLSPDVLVGNNLTFYLTYLGTMITPQNEQIVLSVGTTGMMCDFELNNGEFTPNPTSNGWQWGVDTAAGAHSGTKVWGTLLNNNYPNNVTWTLTSPSVYIGSNFVLEFWHFYNMEATYDGGNLKISTNGVNWSLLTPEGGYTHTNVSALNGPGFSGTNGTWTLVRVNLNSYAGQNVRFRWTFAADNMIQGAGWFIDDVQTTGFINFAGLFSGTVSSSNPGLDFSDVMVQSASMFTASPDAQGNFALYLPSGTHNVTASAPGYLSQEYFPVNLSLDDPIVVHDYYLSYFSPLSALDFQVEDELLTLSWTEPEEPDFPVTGYKVFRRLNAGKYELMQILNDPGYTEQLSELGEYHYYVTVVYQSGESLPSPLAEFQFPYVDDPDDGIPGLATGLYQNYPNPFNPTTTVAFDLAKADNVKLNVYNLRGQLVDCLVDGRLEAGRHRIQWLGTDSHDSRVASGIYLIRMESGGKTFIRKAMLMK
jgi:hypothetical protein